MKKKSISEEVKRRKTFAIISHPDAGKTTLTEKLLLYGGAIRLAGTVKGRKAKKYAVSDWMEIEKQRGISVTSSVLQFEYKGFKINILDTPGHQDFSEDTYRTLMAADSAVMLIDGAKGVEEQTKKLFQVCRMRGISIFTFINKLDRYCKNPFEIMEEIEDNLGIRSCAMNWPVGAGRDFKGVFNRRESRFELFKSENHGQSIVSSSTGNVDDKKLKKILDSDLYKQLCEDIELLDIAGDEFNMDKIKDGELTPMFFGSAMKNFGVQPFLEEFINLAPSPGWKKSSKGMVKADDKDFSGFVFKIQANMNPAHRDRIAFLRVCSGKYEKGIEVNHERTGKNIRLSQSQQFFARERSHIKEAYAGDIIGVFDPGVFNIGDTVYEGKRAVRFEGIPPFPAEHFANIRTKDVMKRKQFLKGINQISEEGAIQVFKEPDIGVERLTIGVVGLLQFEVLEYRMKNEYGVEISIQRLPYKMARWIEYDKAVTKDMLGLYSDSMIVEDGYSRQVVLFKNEWSCKRAAEKNKSIKFIVIPPTS